MNESGCYGQVPMGKHTPTIANLTHRQWLAGRAPHEPAAWFKPVLSPKPESAWRDSDGNLYVAGISEVYRNGVIEQLHDANLEAVEAWERQRRIAFTAQWPWAWADAVLAAESGVVA